MDLEACGRCSRLDRKGVGPVDGQVGRAVENVGRLAFGTDCRNRKGHAAGGEAGDAVTRLICDEKLCAGARSACLDSKGSG